jgi:hypothetical protein
MTNWTAGIRFGRYFYGAGRREQFVAAVTGDRRMASRTTLNALDTPFADHGGAEPHEAPVARPKLHKRRKSSNWRAAI